MDALKDLTNLLGQLKSTSEMAFKQALTPEIIAQMTEEQKALIDQGRNAFNMGDLTLDEKMAQLQKTMKNVSSFNK